MSQKPVPYSWKQLASSLLLVCTSIAYGDDFFGDGLSEREKFALERFGENRRKAHEGLTLLQDMMQFQAFSEGRCEDYFELESAAKKGDLKSQYFLSDLYRKGYCIPQDEKRALFWVRKAAEAGYEDAYFDFGYFLLEGIGGAKNPKAAVAWLEKSKKERPQAYFFLSEAYFRGEGVPQNYEKALDYALQGSSYGDDSAQALATILLSQPSLSFYNPESAYKWGLIARTGGRNNITMALEEVMPELESSLTPKQISEVQSAATRWKPQKQPEEPRVDPTDFDLPVLDEGYSKNLTPKQAQDRLKRLGLDRDRYVFFKAIREDNLEVARLYVRAGASVETVSVVNDQTPLLHAAFNGSARIATYLIVAGADINRSINHANDTPVLLALSSGHRNIAEFLIAKGASLDHPGIMYNAVEYDDPEFLEQLKLRGVPLDNNYVGTPLYNAVAVGDESRKQHCKSKSVAYLLANGAAVNKKGSFGQTPLQNALSAVNPNECVELLLKSGASFEEVSGQEPLFLTLLQGNVDLVRILLDYGADPNLKFRLDANRVPLSLNEKSKHAVMNGGSLLHVAVNEQHAAIARLLVRYGADPNAKDDLGRTPISMAKANGDDLMVAVLSGEM